MEEYFNCNLGDYVEPNYKTYLQRHPSQHDLKLDYNQYLIKLIIENSNYNKEQSIELLKIYSEKDIIKKFKIVKTYFS